MSRLLNSLVRKTVRPGAWLFAVRPLRIVQDDPFRFAVESRRGTFVASHLRRTLSCNGQVLARFVDIESVEVVTDRTDGINGHWAIWAHMGPLVRVKIGDTDDHAHASFVATRLSAALVMGDRALSPKPLVSGS